MKQSVLAVMRTASFMYIQKYTTYIKKKPNTITNFKYLCVRCTQQGGFCLIVTCAKSYIVRITGERVNSSVALRSVRDQIYLLGLRRDGFAMQHRDDAFKGRICRHTHTRGSGG